ncbi:acyltransferase family protein [Devosia sp. A449]
MGLATLRDRIGTLPRLALYAALILGLAGLIEGFAVDRGVMEDGLAFAGFVLFASALVLLGIHFEPRLPRVAILERIGDASYSIYLVHIYEVAILAGLAFKLLDPADLWADYFVAAVSIAGGTIAGLLLYRFVEQPALRYFSALLGARRPAPVAQAAE